MISDFRFCVAPMMDCTDRHARYFLRLISHHARLYTEMVVDAAIIHGDRDRLLGFDASEHPLALQLGGSTPSILARAAEIGADYGYDEINFNVGCPSSRVQSGTFGACLMRTPSLVAECAAAMIARVSCPVTIKCRLGVDDQDPHDALFTLVSAGKSAGVRHFIIHARKAWLAGLNPKQNREVPPLDYSLVYELKRTHPDCVIVLNGGISTLDSVADHLKHVDGVMLGRAAYRVPYLLADVDRRFFGAAMRDLAREDILDQFIFYIERQLSHGIPLRAMTRHILGLYAGQPYGKRWRHILAEISRLPSASAQVLRTVSSGALFASTMDEILRVGY